MKIKGYTGFLVFKVFSLKYYQHAIFYLTLANWQKKLKSKNWIKKVTWVWKYKSINFEIGTRKTQDARHEVLVWNKTTKEAREAGGHVRHSARKARETQEHIRLWSARAHEARGTWRQGSTSGNNHVRHKFSMRHASR